jgi:hypothetical protein
MTGNTNGPYLPMALPSGRAIGTARRVGRRKRAKMSLMPTAVGLLLQVNTKGRWHKERFRQADNAAGSVRRRLTSSLFSA